MRAPALGSLASTDWWPQQGAYLPPAPLDWVLREAIRDIFQASTSHITVEQRAARYEGASEQRDMRAPSCRVLLSCAGDDVAPLAVPLLPCLQLPALPTWPGGAAVAWPLSTAGQHGWLGKAAPLGALISRQGSAWAPCTAPGCRRRCMAA